jgi:hypothetical protein
MPTLDANDNLLFVLMGIGLVDIVMAMWQLAIVVSGIAEVHQFSTWRGLGTLLLAGLLLLPLLLIPIIAFLTLGSFS